MWVYYSRQIFNASWANIKFIVHFFFPRSSCKARRHGQGATVLQFKDNKDTSKNLRGFVDKNEARVAPGSGLLYSGVVYIGTDDLDTICWQQSNGEKSQTRHCQTTQIFKTAIEKIEWPVPNQLLSTLKQRSIYKPLTTPKSNEEKSQTVICKPPK